MFASSVFLKKKVAKKTFFYLLFLISLHHFEQVMTLANSRFAFNIAALMNRRGKIFHSTCIYEKTHFFWGRRVAAKGKAGNYLTYI